MFHGWHQFAFLAQPLPMRLGSSSASVPYVLHSERDADGRIEQIRGYSFHHNSHRKVLHLTEAITLVRVLDFTD